MPFKKFMTKNTCLLFSNKMRKNLFLSILTSFLTPLLVFAVDYVPLAPIEGYVTQGTVGAGLEAYVANMYRLGVGIATLLAVLMVIWGGVEYMTTDAWGHKEEGKERIQSALFGLMLALGSYVIIATIDKSILDINFSVLDRAENKLSAEDQFRLVTPEAINSLSPQEKANYENRLLDAAGKLSQRAPDESFFAGKEVSGPVTGKATNFGYNDSEDSGYGSPLVGDGKGGMVATNNTNIRGVALPREVLENFFQIPKGSTKYSDWEGVRRAAVEVTNSSGKREVVPIVDIGPGIIPVSRGVVIDETKAVNQNMGGDGQRTYRIVPNYYQNEDDRDIEYVKK